MSNKNKLFMISAFVVILVSGGLFLLIAQNQQKNLTEQALPQGGQKEYSIGRDGVGMLYLCDQSRIILSIEQIPLAVQISWKDAQNNESVEEVDINGIHGFYFEKISALLGTVSGRRLVWKTNTATIQIRSPFSPGCIDSKEEFVKMAESMEPRE